MVFARSRQRFNSIPKPRGDQGGRTSPPWYGFIGPQMPSKIWQTCLAVAGVRERGADAGGSGGTEFKNCGVRLGLTPCSKS
jgi:hypothetical protein